MGVAAQKYFIEPEILGVKVDLAIAILGPEDWAKLTKLPYGMQHIIDGTSTAVLAASSDNMLVNGYLAGKDFVPKEIFERLEKLGFTYEEAAAKFVDLIGFHEMGHIYAHAYGIVTWPAIKWLSEYVATYLAYSFMMENRPNLAGLWLVMTDVNADGKGMEHITIADFEELYNGRYL